MRVESKYYGEKYNGYELDVFLVKEKIGIEIDGGYWHKDKVCQDRKKNETLKTQGITVVRLRGEGLSKLSPFDSCYKKNERHKVIINRLLEGMLENSLLNKNAVRIMQEYITENKYRSLSEYRRILEYLPGPMPEKSLQSQRPDIASEWHPTKNEPLTPTMF
ncbi:MAG: DUF559 domain-containing protein [Candidatus Aegiribacteria sp.]|nr:DUF559 domain-containing protein [Candidatus Aegiribacteria sp.]